jgi:hypothetical protein
MKNVLNEMLIEKAHTVIRVDAYSDRYPTVQKRDKILGLIKKRDNSFYQIIKDMQNTSFVFGDKYFAPANDEVFFCIPKDAITYSLNGLTPYSEFIKDIEADFRKQKKFFSGYFEL